MEDKKQWEDAMGTEQVQTEGAPPKTGNRSKSGGAAALVILLALGFCVWFIFFRSTAPKEVTTKMLESGIVEAITEKEIVRQLENSNFSYYLDGGETVEVGVSMPNLVSQNPKYHQTGDRYEVRDGYGYPVEMPLELHLTIEDIYGDSVTSEPIDITVSGVIVYVTDAKTYAFRNVEIEYEEDFQSLLDLADFAALW